MVVAQLKHRAMTALLHFNAMTFYNTRQVIAYDAYHP
jgi:hypothetical protein